MATERQYYLPKTGFIDEQSFDLANEYYVPKGGYFAETVAPAAGGASILPQMMQQHTGS